MAQDEKNTPTKSSSKNKKFKLGFHKSPGRLNQKKKEKTAQNVGVEEDIINIDGQSTSELQNCDESVNSASKKANEVVENEIISGESDLSSEKAERSDISALKRSNAKKRNHDIINKADDDSNLENTEKPFKNRFRFSLRRTPSKAAQNTFQEIAISGASRKKKDIRGKQNCASQLDDEDLKASFDLFDRDHDGTITVDEISLVLHTLGQSPTVEEITEIIAEIDTDGDGKISMDEFKTLMHRLMESNEFHDNQFVEETFNDFDVYGDGMIGREDLVTVFRKLGDCEITNEEIDEMLRDATSRPNRKVDLEEFKAVIRGNNHLNVHVSGCSSKLNVDC